jgi:hypothetical protein
MGGVAHWAAISFGLIGGCAPSYWSTLGERKRGESGSWFEIFVIQDS